MTAASVTVTCVGCGKTGKADLDSFPPNTLALCPDCGHRAAAILSEHMAVPVKVGFCEVIEDGDDQ